MRRVCLPAVVLGSSLGLSAQFGLDTIAALRTTAESSNYEETSTQADVEQFAAGLDASPFVHVEPFGTTEEGRDLTLLVVSDPGVSTPEAARRLGRPIVLVQANIHGGEVEGKEASLALARRLVAGDLAPLTRQLVILIAPNYNADGNERINIQNRTAQNGPAGGVGTRENARGLDLNRDYMKVDSAEARVLVGLLNHWDPHVIVDLHTTNGSYHGYHLTYSPALNPNTDPRLIAFERDTLLPAVRASVETRHGFRSYYYGNFSTESGGPAPSRIDPNAPGDVVWRTFDHRPRFGNNYGGLRNRIAILSEAYSYLDFKSRIDVTSAFVEELLRVVAARAGEIMSLTAEADRTLVDAAAENHPRDLGVAFEARPSPRPVAILVGDITRVLNPRSGREMSQMADRAVPVRMREYGTFAATKSVLVPDGWAIPRTEVESGRADAVIERLAVHGIRSQALSAPTRTAVERFAIARIVAADRLFQNRRETRLEGWHETATLTLDAGSIVIPARQPLGRLAFALLEAESDDGLATWGLVEGLAVGQPFPIYRIVR
jgi:hypothetical protein